MSQENDIMVNIPHEVGVVSLYRLMAFVCGKKMRSHDEDYKNTLQLYNFGCVLKRAINLSHSNCMKL
jgi:hypothetical protein